MSVAEKSRQIQYASQIAKIRIRENLIGVIAGISQYRSAALDFSFFSEIA
jgi:hypothetical protein